VAPAFTKREMAKLAAARELIEPALAAESALRRTPEFLADLAETIEELAGSATRADSDADSFRLYWTSDARFHSLIAAQADNPFLESAFLALSGSVQRFRLFMKAGHAHAGQAAAEHQRILDALASDDPDIAAEQIHAHVKAATERALSEHQ
jgi:DNA-binding GntR family transcriptional regulator